MNIDEVKAMLKTRKRTQIISPGDYLSSGSSLLNLACTGDANKCFLKGYYYHIVGDSQSGKTFLSLTCLAEATLNPAFKDHRFIFDNAEDGALMDIRHFFGAKVADKIEAPQITKKGTTIFSNTIEDFYYHVDDAVKDGRPFIYILDSMDSLSSEAEKTKFQDQKKANRKNKIITGSMGDGKAKKNSGGIRQLIPALKASGSILIVISQTRDNMGFGFETKSRSGGHALKFYATLEIWSSCGKKIKKTVRGKDRPIGINSILKIKKNRVAGKDRQITVPIYYALGFDDVGGCIDYLLDENHWKQTGQTIIAPEFDFEGTKTKLIDIIEGGKLETKLRSIVQKVWDEIETACDPGRKPRYE